MAHSTAEGRSTDFSVELLREHYVEAGMSRRQFAASIDVPEQTLRRLEGGRGIRPANAKRIADHFGVRVADVLALADSASAA